MNAFSATASVASREACRFAFIALSMSACSNLFLGKERGEGGEREQRATPLRKRFHTHPDVASVVVGLELGLGPIYGVTVRH